MIPFNGLIQRSRAKEVPIRKVDRPSFINFARFSSSEKLKCYNID